MPTSNELTTVLLSKEDAALFILFQQNYDNIAFIIASKALQVKKGSVTLDFDSSGKIQAITRKLSTHRSDLPLTQDEVYLS